MPKKPDLPPFTEENLKIFNDVADGDVAAVRARLDAGLHVDHRLREGGSTLLSMAIHEGRDMVAELLLERGADPRLGSPPVVERKLRRAQRDMVNAAMRRINADEKRRLLAEAERAELETLLPKGKQPPTRTLKSRL